MTSDPSQYARWIIWHQHVTRSLLLTLQSNMSLRESCYHYFRYKLAISNLASEMSTVSAQSSLKWNPTGPMPNITYFFTYLALKENLAKQEKWTVVHVSSCKVHVYWSVLCLKVATSHESQSPSRPQNIYLAKKHIETPFKTCYSTASPENQAMTVFLPHHLQSHLNKCF